MAFGGSAREGRGGRKASPKAENSMTFDPRAALPAGACAFQVPPQALLARPALLSATRAALLLPRRESRQLKGSSHSHRQAVPALHQGAPAQIKAL